jgi:hypothetical protein
VRLPADIEDGLRRLSIEEHKTQAEVVRSLIAERLAQSPPRTSAYAIAQSLGIIGSDSDRRTDTAERHSDYVRAALIKKSKRAAKSPPPRKRGR